MDDEKIIHRVYLAQGEIGQSTSLSVADLWQENSDAPLFFQRVLSTLANGRVYDDSDAPDTYCFYTTSDIAKLKTAVEAWYTRPDIDHPETVDDWAQWYEHLLSA